MAITKNKTLAILQMIENLASEIDKLDGELHKNISSKDLTFHQKLFDISHALITHSTTAANAYTELRDAGFLDNVQDGQKILTATVSVNPEFLENVSVSLPLPDNGTLTAYTAISDCNTPQVGTMYNDKDKYPVDLTLTEMKRGELAESSGKAENNQDLDIMVWSDPYQEDYQEKYTISYDELEKALGSDGIEK